MSIKIFETIAEKLVSAPESLSPIRSGSGPALLNAINDRSRTFPDMNLLIDSLPEILQSLGGDELGTDIRKLISAARSANPLDLIKAVLSIPVDLPSIVEGFLSHQIEVAAALLSIVDAASNPVATLNSLQNAYGQYFFDGGFATVPDQKIAPPAFPSAGASATDLAGFFSQKTGDRYIRDLIRVGIESISNQWWKLEACYAAIDKTKTITDPAKAKKWFAGFGDYAEASVTAAIEQAAQGIASFQTNPLIAATFSTAAGTAARKAAQKTFFAELNITG